MSVIIPTYNRAWVLQEAIDSVLGQDFNDYELIVVDDGSEDNTLEILEAYGKAIKVLHQENRGRAFWGGNISVIPFIIPC